MRPKISVVGLVLFLIVTFSFLVVAQVGAGAGVWFTIGAVLGGLVVMFISELVQGLE